MTEMRTKALERGFGEGLHEGACGGSACVLGAMKGGRL
jgi:hypothetical protein